MQLEMSCADVFWKKGVASTANFRYVNAMSEEPESLVLQLLREMRVEFASLRGELASKTDALASKTDALTSDMGALRAELTSDMRLLRAELTLDMRSLRAELRSDMRSLRAELQSEVHSLRADVASDLHVSEAKQAQEHRQTREQIVGLRRAVVEYHTAVVGHGIIVGDLEERVRRIERHVGLVSPQVP